MGNSPHQSDRVVAWVVRQDLCRGGELFDRIAQGDLGGEAQATVAGEVCPVESEEVGHW